MTDPLHDALAALGAGRSLTADQSFAAVSAIVGGEAGEAAVSAFLAALRVKGETAEELLGAVRAVRERMTPLEGPLPALLDTCGTGGDGAKTLNVSTAAAIVVAACGVPVAKHGNRSASGNSGSAEVLAELGIDIEPAPEALARGLRELGIAFLFAPRFHPALRHAAPVRRRLPFRTLFNLVGPLANPARPTYQLIGVPDAALAELLARVLVELRVECAAVVTGSDGLDEVTLAGPTEVLWVARGQVHPETWEPGDFGLPRVGSEHYRVSGPAESAAILSRLLRGEPGPARQVVLANAAAALKVAGRVRDLREGAREAAEAIDSGAAARLLDRWRAISRPPA